MVVYHIVIVLYMSMGSHMTQGDNIKWEGYFVLVYLSVFFNWSEEPNKGIIDIRLSHIRPLRALAQTGNTKRRASILLTSFPRRKHSHRRDEAFLKLEVAWNPSKKKKIQEWYVIGFNEVS